MIGQIARRNLLYDQRRFAAAIAGVAFSVALVVVQLGLFVGLAANASQVIDRSPGDIWITGRNTGNFQWGQPISRRALTVARNAPGVAWAREIIVGWTQVRHPAGGSEQLEVVGFDPVARVGAPWNVVAGRLEDLLVPGRIVLDRSSFNKVGRFEVGDTREIFDHRVRIAAVTEGITSFTTVPLAFSSLATARTIIGYMGPDDTVYVVAGLEPGASVAATVAALSRRLPHVDVFSSEVFSARTRRYWMVETGMGIGFLLTSALAIAVGAVIVGQVVYTATNEHLPEYGTLKAMGMSNRGLASVVLAQAFIAALAGSLAGCVIGALVVGGIRQRGLDAVVAPGLTVATVLAALCTSAVAAVSSAKRVWKLEPALVFRG